jgi:hypothetical protein
VRALQLSQYAKAEDAQAPIAAAAEMK